MRAELLRNAKSGRYTFLLEGDSADITALLAVIRAGGDCTVTEIIGEKNAANPKHVQILRTCLHSLFMSLIDVAMKFDQYLKQK